MNNTLRSILAVVFVGVIIFSAISISQNLWRAKLDVTDDKIYTLSPGTKSILAKLNQPLKIKLYYARTAAMKAPDQIRFFNNYYTFVNDLLEEYVAASNGMVNLEVVDPRPFSEDEQDALRFGLKRFAITEEESFFFGMAVQTEFGAGKSIPFFDPERQNFVEYDISYLIDTVITREKKRIGILSSLSIMGEQGYMAQMLRMQGKKPSQPWGLIQQLQQRYEVNQIKADTDEINPADMDVLLVIHPKNLPEKTLFAIDQFVLKGGRTIVCVDPHCLMDRPDPQARMMRQMPSTSSNLDPLLKTWGLEMPPLTFAGDRSLALRVPLAPNQRPQKMISFLNLASNLGCFNPDSVITGELNQVVSLFSGVLQEIPPSEGTENQEITRKLTPLIQTTAQGNSWKIENPMELQYLSGDRLSRLFTDGVKPVVMGYLITGRFASSFPEGVKVPVEEDNQTDDSTKNDDNKEKKPGTETLKGLTQASTDCAVAVFADVDFISDQTAYRRSFFGGLQLVGDNSALLMNTIENLSGSGDLISIRSRGNFRRSFTLVDQIEREASEKTEKEEAEIQAKIEEFQKKLSEIVREAGSKGETIIDATELMAKKQKTEIEIAKLQKNLRDIQNQKRVEIDRLGNTLRNINMLAAPTVILAIAVVLGIYRGSRRRHYISHASDA